MLRYLLRSITIIKIRIKYKQSLIGKPKNRNKQPFIYVVSTVNASFHNYATLYNTRNNHNGFLLTSPIHNIYILNCSNVASMSKVSKFIYSEKMYFLLGPFHYKLPMTLSILTFRHDSDNIRKR